MQEIREFGACPRKPCNNGYYPIHEAAKNASSRTMEVFLQWGESRGCTREEMISFYDSEGNVPLHSAVHGGDIKAVELCLKSGAKISTQQHDLSTPVHLACAQGAIDIVKLMFGMQPTEKMQCLASCDGADINPLDKEKRSPLLLASSRAGWRTVQALIRLGANINLKDVNSRNVLHLVVMNGGRLVEFADEVIKKGSFIINESDGEGLTPLHIASQQGHTRVVQLLLNRGALLHRDHNGRNPLHLAAMSGYTQTMELLHSVHSHLLDQVDKDGIKYSFSCLQCPTMYAQMDQRTGEALMISKPIPLPALNIKYSFHAYQLSAETLEKKRKQLNDPRWRPAPLSVVNMKWNSYGKYFHLANLLFYCVFLAFVTIFAAQLMDSGEISQNSTNIKPTYDSHKNLPVQYTCAMVIIAYIVLNSLREILQLYQQRWHYLLDPINLVSWSLYIAAIIMIMPVFTDEFDQLQLSCASVTVFLSWFNLLLYLQRFDQVGIYVVMFLEILQTLIKVLIVFSILIIAFGLAFYILLSRGNHLSFKNVPISLIRTFSMMLGEIDFLGTYVQPYYEPRNKELPYPIPAFLILGLFMVLMPILLMNLLIGLAVGDIDNPEASEKKNISQDCWSGFSSHLKCLSQHEEEKREVVSVVLHTELERKLPHFLLDKVDKMELIEFPNDTKCKLGFLDTLLRKWFWNPFSDDGLEMMLDSSDDYVSEELVKQKKRLKEISSALETQHLLLRLIVQKMEIKTEADDVDEGVSPNEIRPLLGIANKWTSPRVRKKLRSTLSFTKTQPT
ncbi:Transient receptor potential cation channel subfamily A member 1 [Blattella germanica]|nr:Transient receptor potential cation channel subfamily A member 1 [Blattella germanica]